MANEVNVDPRYSKYSSQQIEDVLDKVHNADEQPTAESGNMISSGAVAAALGNYNTKEEVTELLSDKQDTMTEASEEEIRNIVRNWSPDQQPEPEEQEEEPGE